MNEELFKSPEDYYKVVDTIKNLYVSNGALQTLMDFERVLDEMDFFAYKNWLYGELVEGPDIKRYTVSCTFLWPGSMMPDPRAGKKIIPFGCKVYYKKSTMLIPVKVKDYDDFRPNTKKPKIIKQPVWLVEIIMPKDLMSDIRQGSIEIEDEILDLEDLDLAYEAELQDEAVKSEDIDEFATDMEDQSLGGSEDDLGLEL